MTGEQARQMARANSEPFGQPVHAAAVKLTVLDEHQGTFDGCPGALPRRAERRRFGTASEAGPEAGVLGSGRATIECHIASERRARRTDGTAIDPGRLDSDEHDAVQRGVAAAKGFISSIEVEHGAAIAPALSRCESDTVTTSENVRCAARQSARSARRSPTHRCRQVRRGAGRPPFRRRSSRCTSGCRAPYRWRR